MQHRNITHQFKILAVLLTTITFSLTGCKNKPSPSTAAAAPAADTVAMVGSQIISQRDLDHACELNSGKSAAAVLEDIGREEALAQLAHAQGLASDPSVKSAIRNLLASRMRENHFKARVFTEEEISAKMAGLQAAAPPQKIERRLAVLRLRFENAGGQENAIKRLTDFAKQYSMDDSLGFGVAASSYSDDVDTRYQGGDYGWISEGQDHPLLPKPVNERAAALQSSRQLSDIVVADEAAWIVMFWGSRPVAGQKPSNRAQIEAQMKHQDEQEQASALIQSSQKTFPLIVLKAQKQTNATSSQSSPPASKSAIVPSLPR